MTRRWIIRSFFIGLPLLFSVGWLASYKYRSNIGSPASREYLEDPHCVLSFTWLLLPTFLAIALIVVLLLLPRRRLAILAALSLVAALAIAAEWGRSYYWRDTFTLYTYTQQPPGPLDHFEYQWYQIHTGYGNIAWEPRYFIDADDYTTYDWRKTVAYYRKHNPQFEWSASPESGYDGWNDTGLPIWGWRTPRENWWAHFVDWYSMTHRWPGRFGPAPTELIITFRMGLLYIPLSIFPILWLISRFRRHSLRKRGLCDKCGFDLRASKDRCPECGNPIPAQPIGSP